MAEKISFHRHEVKFRLPDPALLKVWISAVVRAHHRKINSVGYVFCSDAFLLEINRQFLRHDYLTDIITFDLSTTQKKATSARRVGTGTTSRPTNLPELSSEIYISIDRVRENAQGYGIPFTEELQRVMIHGILHLLGNKDKTKAQKALMRQKEDACLSLLHVPRGTWSKRINRLFHVEH